MFVFNLLWFSKMQVMAARDIDYDVSPMERRLLPQLNTCLRSCTSDSDCSDCILCCHCNYMTFNTFQCGPRVGV
ncbi:hypothetical protein A4A49_34020 [Nicotiana attenuata]|uniref:Carboxypeptidase A inhibitor-like domain-containing protein n=1 Tax=Nicotiana attenuata TaxID=49451 RepID=A0A1J6KQV1_NICAT|nr:hypothetical protein A4A49_34020 [Nicotiana attenuata]